MTYSELVADGVKRLADAGFEEARTDVRDLVFYVCGMDFMTLLRDGGMQVPEEQEKRFSEVLARRMNHEPVQYITGEQEFCGLRFFVQPGVLIPRPETELLAEAVFTDAKGKRVLDMCTGSGCILLSILAKGKEMQGIGVDISEKALTVARNNAKRLGINKAEFILSDMFAQIKAGEKYDVITSNPPYIESGVIPTLMEEVRVYEPLNALDGGADGLEFYRILARDAEKHLNPGGRIYMEIGYNQGKAVQDLFLDAGYDFVKVYQDYAGLDRVVVCSKTELI